MSELAAYERCLTFDRVKMNSLLQEDQDIWVTNVNEAQQRAKLAQARIQNFLEKQQAELLSFLKQNELTTIMGREPPKIRKLPLWGITNVPDNEINFEWPKQRDLMALGSRQMPELQSITFLFKDSNTVCMRGVQFTHVNNLRSPVFETGDITSVALKVEQPVLKSTTMVTACCRETQRDSIKSLSFLGSAGILEEVNHYKREVGVKLPVYHLNPGEEIIGGYGVSNRQSFITSFGFILLKRPN